MRSVSQPEFSQNFKDVKTGGSGKGFVRDEILNLLSLEPQTSTEISRRIKVSKSTISYHLGRMLARGDVEIIRFEHDKKGFARKFYSLKNKSKFFIVDSTQDEGVLKKIEGTFTDLKELLNTRTDTPVGLAIRNTLFHMLRFIPKTTRIRHDQIMYTYGFKIGREILSKYISGVTVGEVFRNAKEFWQRNQMGVMEIPSVRGAPRAILVNNCFDCEVAADRGGLLCHFVQGLLDGTLGAKFGSEYKFTSAKYQEPGTIFCEFSLSYL